MCTIPRSHLSEFLATSGESSTEKLRRDVTKQKLVSALLSEVTTHPPVERAIKNSERKTEIHELVLGAQKEGRRRKVKKVKWTSDNGTEKSRT